MENQERSKNQPAFEAEKRNTVFVEKARHFIQTMKESAEELTEALGLPPETKYDVLSVTQRGRSASTPAADAGAPEEQT